MTSSIHHGRCRVRPVAVRRSVGLLTAAQPRLFFLHFLQPHLHRRPLCSFVASVTEWLRRKYTVDCARVGEDRSVYLSPAEAASAPEVGLVPLQVNAERFPGGYPTLRASLTAVLPDKFESEGGGRGARWEELRGGYIIIYGSTVSTMDCLS